MKLAVTINLGNYESIKIESGEYEDVFDCKGELNVALATIREARVDAFRKRILQSTGGIP
jgi:hypothetical protein